MKEYKGRDFLPDNKELKISSELEKADREEEEKIRLRERKEKKRQTIEKFFKKFLGKEDLEEIKKLFSIEKINKNFREIIEELFNDNEKLVKSKKEETIGEEKNRNIYSELQKLDMYKDTSKLQEKIIYYLFPEMKSKLKVDYRSTIRYIEGETNEQITKRPDKTDIPEFLFNVSKVSEYFLEKFQVEREKILLDNAMSKIIKNFDKNLVEGKNSETLDKEEFEKTLSEIKKEITEDKELKRKIYKWFIFFLQLHYNMNEEEAYLEILEQLKEIEREKIKRERLCVIISYCPDELSRFLDDLRKRKDNLKEEKFKSTYWYLYTVVFDYEKTKSIKLGGDIFKYSNCTDENIWGYISLLIGSDYTSNINKLAFYEGVYLSEVKYKGKKLSSYLDCHRKSEFLLYIYDHLIENREMINYDDLIPYFFTNKEIDDFLNSEKIELNKSLDSYSTDGENNYISEIIKTIKNNPYNKTHINEKLKKITSLYVNVKKRHGEFENNQTIHRDIKLIINFIYNLYFYSYMDYRVYISLKESILDLIDLEKSHINELKKVLTLKNN